MKSLRLLAALIAAISLDCSVSAHEIVTRARTTLNIPDVPGYFTLKCDFHIHTVFSDGKVWPTVRSDEAWREGLDAIAITEHIEVQPHKKDIPTEHNRGYEIAKEAGDGLNLMVIHGSEITRKMPPGHANAIFLSNSVPLAVTNWLDSYKAARAQGAFIFWNHPGWSVQITNNNVIWYPEHTSLKEQDLLHGIEVVNGRDYYPDAHKWAIEKKLAIMSNSDVHDPSNLDYHVLDGDHRPMTLVFARARTIESIKEALFERRTAAYGADRLIGDEQFLKPIFEKSVRFDRSELHFLARKKVTLQVLNDSDIDYSLELDHAPDGFTVPVKLTLPARKTVLFPVESGIKPPSDRDNARIRYAVTNLLVAPGTPLKITLPIKLTFGDK